MKEYNRHSIRLKNFDYSQPGFYFVTICVQNRQCLFGDIKNGELKLNDVGKMIKKCWEQMTILFPVLSINEFVVMPDHFHAIVDISLNSDQVLLSRIIGSFKSITTNEYIHGVNDGTWMPFDKRLWQRNYYEHIIRDIFDYNRIVDYIKNNPKSWNHP